MKEEEHKIKITMKPSFDMEKQILSIETFYNGALKSMTEDAISFKDKCVREAIVAMGWTPPGDNDLIKSRELLSECFDVIGKSSLCKKPIYEKLLRYFSEPKKNSKNNICHACGGDGTRYSQEGILLGVCDDCKGSGLENNKIIEVVK